MKSPPLAVVFSPFFFSVQYKEKKKIWRAIRLSWLMNNLIDILLNLIVLYYHGHRRRRRSAGRWRNESSWFDFNKLCPVCCNYLWPGKPEMSERCGAALTGLGDAPMLGHYYISAISGGADLIRRLPETYQLHLNSSCCPVQDVKASLSGFDCCHRDTQHGDVTSNPSGFFYEITPDDKRWETFFL